MKQQSGLFRSRNATMGYCMALGVAIGAGGGALIGNLAVGIALGIAAGAIVALTSRKEFRSVTSMTLDYYGSSAAGAAVSVSPSRSTSDASPELRSASM